MKTRFKSQFKRNRTASVLNKAIEGEGQPKERLTKKGLQPGEAVSRRVRRNGEDVLVSETVQEPKTYFGIDI